nr:alpha/beta fold hydrolase [Actinomycetota bacterium]
MADYVLVHGAWHGGWCWKRLTPLLRAAGHQVFTPTLTGLGERRHLMSPDIGLETHIKDVLGVLTYEDLDDVILVGHSYSGMVVTGVAYSVPDRIAQLVYLDAFVPEEGKALVDYQPPQTRELFVEKTRTEGEGFKLPALIPPEAFGITDEADLAWVRPRLDPHPFKTKLDPVRFDDPRGAGIPRTFIRCTDPADLPFAQFAEHARSDGSWRYVELATGHAAMITKPRELADLLLGLAGRPVKG